jgi:hypothetical protein
MASITRNDYPVTVTIKAYEECKQLPERQGSPTLHSLPQFLALQVTSLTPHPTDRTEPWCHIITARIEDPNTHTQVAHTVAYLIDRMKIEGNVDDGLLELSETFEELFYDEIFYHDVTMEHFVLWHEVVVEPEYRKQGAGRSEYAPVVAGTLPDWR